MEKKRKIVRLTESELTGLIHNTLKTVMNEVIDDSNYGRNILNEMACLKKKMTHYRHFHITNTNYGYKVIIHHINLPICI